MLSNIDRIAEAFKKAQEFKKQHSINHSYIRCSCRHVGFFYVDDVEKPVWKNTSDDEVVSDTLFRMVAFWFQKGYRVKFKIEFMQFYLDMECEENYVRLSNVQHIEEIAKFDPMDCLDAIYKRLEEIREYIWNQEQSIKEGGIWDPLPEDWSKSYLNVTEKLRFTLNVVENMLLNSEFYKEAVLTKQEKYLDVLRSKYNIST